ncbi:ferrochelatase [Limosilactobacillus reuteri]
MKKNGLLLVNLGSPDTPTTADVKRYLKEFLSDRNVMEVPPALWRPRLAH